MLAGSSKSSVNVTVKWDGAPAIFAGINPENGQFFVGTKGVFNKNAKINYSHDDIDRNHPSSGLNQKLKVALTELSKLGIKDVLQGDMMFTQEDLENKTIDGKQYVTFQPNTIVYAVPMESAQRILSSKMGIVFHTTYSGKTMEDMSASFSVNLRGLAKPLMYGIQMLSIETHLVVLISIRMKLIQLPRYCLKQEKHFILSSLNF